MKTYASKKLFKDFKRAGLVNNIITTNYKFFIFIFNLQVSTFVIFWQIEREQVTEWWNYFYNDVGSLFIKILSTYHIYLSKFGNIEAVFFKLKAKFALKTFDRMLRP